MRVRKPTRNGRPALARTLLRAEGNAYLKKAAGVWGVDHQHFGKPIT